MKRVFAAVAVLTLLMSTAVAASNGVPWKAPPFSSIGVYRVELDASFREPAAPSVLAAFVETGSQNDRCLATLSELAAPGTDQMPFSVFCAPRNPTFDGNALEGVWLHIFFFDDPGEDVYLAVNVYQEGARFYSLARPCFDEDGC